MANKKTDFVELSYILINILLVISGFVYLVLFSDSRLITGAGRFFGALFLSAHCVNHYFGPFTKRRYNKFFIVFWLIFTLSALLEFQPLNSAFLIFLFIFYNYVALAIKWIKSVKKISVLLILASAALLLITVFYLFGLVINLNQAEVMSSISNLPNYFAWMVNNLFDINYLIRRFGILLSLAIYLTKFLLIGFIASLVIEFLFVQILKLNRYLYIKGLLLAICTILIILIYGYVERNKLVFQIRQVYISINLKNNINKNIVNLFRYYENSGSAGKNNSKLSALLKKDMKLINYLKQSAGDNYKIVFYEIIPGKRIVKLISIPRPAVINDNSFFYKHEKLAYLRRDFSDIACVTKEYQKLVKRNETYNELFSGTAAGMYKDIFYIIQANDGFISEFMAQFNAVFNGVLQKVLLIAVIIIPVMVIFLISRFIIPVLNLKSATQKVSSGNYNIDVPVTSTDELGQLSQSFNDMAAELKMQELIKYTFGRYVSHAVVERILKDPESAKPITEKRVVSIMFADIRGFTTYADMHTPEEVSESLNEYFEIMVETVFEYDGTIDKFMGDCLMVVFGAPLFQEDHYSRVVKCALKIKSAIENLSKSRVERGQVPIQLGIGINTGEAMVGNIGASKRLEFTVIGASVNLASRLESLAKPGQILISANTYSLVKDEVDAVSLPPQLVKGISEPVEVYELLKLK